MAGKGNDCGLWMDGKLLWENMMVIGMGMRKENDVIVKEKT